MRYDHIRDGVFLSRPNRFIANVTIGGAVQVCHVKNTGRCRELLVPGARVWVQERDDPSRRTKYDLIAVLKGQRLINMDSSAPTPSLGSTWPRGGSLRPPPSSARRRSSAPHGSTSTWKPARAGPFWRSRA